MYQLIGGGYSQVLATLELMKETEKRSVVFSFYHFISGQDYPLVNNETFDRFFEKYKDNSFVEIDDRPYTERYDLYHLNDVVNVLSFPYNKIEGALAKLQKVVNRLVRLRESVGFKIYKGSNWWSINKDMFDYIKLFLRENKDYIGRFRHTSCCDEIFFHTIMFNSAWKKSIVTDNLRYVDWHRKYKNETLPRVLDETDYERIINTSSFFCRKIDPVISSKLKDKILKRIEEM